MTDKKQYRKILDALYETGPAAYSEDALDQLRGGWRSDALRYLEDGEYGRATEMMQAASVARQFLYFKKRIREQRERNREKWTAQQIQTPPPIRRVTRSTTKRTTVSTTRRT